MGTASGGTLASHQQILVLGRVVDVMSLRAGPPLTPGAPDQEFSDPASDFSIALLYDESIHAFRLSTGARLWSATPYAPTRQLAIAGKHVYVECGDKLLAYAKADGTLTYVRPERASEMVAAGGLVASLGYDGRVDLYDAATNERLASKTLPEIPRPWHNGLVASPSINGICAFGLHDDPLLPHGWVSKVGCYDRSLSPLWSKVESFAFPPSKADVLTAMSNLVRQTGPHHLVLDHLPYGELPKTGHGSGVIIRWRDGQTVAFNDHTFATVEDSRGERIVAPEVLEIFARKIAPATNLSSDYRQAKIVSDGKRAFALIIQQASTSLAAVDLVKARLLFHIHVPLDDRGWKLDLAGERPLLRVDLGNSVIATIHDPETGKVLYRDERRYR